MNLVRVYDLRDDRQRVELMQAASLNRPDLGLAIEPALVGSEKWWAMVEDHSLPETVTDGVITRVYWASMGDWPEFELEETNGGRSSWTREGDISRYVDGLGVRLGFVRHPWKKQNVDRMSGTHRSLVTFIEVEESSRRSDPRAPGPGGIGLRLPEPQ
jgi:hypothetical protein